MDLPSRWPLPGAADLRDELLAAYADESRGYHDTTHLTEVLTRLDELAEAGCRFERLPVELAAWFHDSVYDGERDAEERSAAWAEDALPSAGVTAAVVAEVARLVRLTETHLPEDGDDNGCALSDADLAILASGAERYDEYVEAVRREYDFMPEAEFRAGRAHVLGSLADKPHLYHSPLARERWESPARTNVARELESLHAPV